MTVHSVPHHALPTDRSRTALVTSPRRFRRLWHHLRNLVAGVDAGARIAHGSAVPPEHPARRRERDRIELERRLTTRFPRT